MRPEPQVVRCTRCGCEYRVPRRSTIVCRNCGNDSWVLAQIRLPA